MSINWHLILSMVLAALLPVALIATGVELRRVRFRIVQDLQSTIFAGAANLPQVLLAMARYGPLKDTDHPGRQDEVRYWSGAFIYMMVSFLGFAVLFIPVSSLLSSDMSFGIADSVFWAPVKTEPSTRPSAAAIAGFAFLGGYVFNLRYLITQTLNQELSALAFVRSALRLLQGVILAMAVYHVGAASLGGADGLQSGTLAAALLLAFVLGYFPDLGIARIAEMARVHVKTVNKSALSEAKIVPLEMIDGIDHEIAFRLQESNLYDVQNLAVANPLELYAETPYTLLQTFDWILQAQLCLSVGPRSFIELKKHRIRTIFDLERAVLSVGVPAAYLRAIACVLLVDSSECFRGAVGLSKKYEECVDDPEAQPTVIRHLVAVMADDLHVHRLRALWQAVTESTAGFTKEGRPLWLFNTGWLPGDDGIEPQNEVNGGV
jgi:hypothetical protein